MIAFVASAPLHLLDLLMWNLLAHLDREKAGIPFSSGWGAYHDQCMTQRQKL
jgi:hypothetical protein